MNTVMEVNGLKAEINMPDVINQSYIDAKGIMRTSKELKSFNEDQIKEMGITELPSGLPPYNRRPVHVVDEYNCPSNWMHGSSKASSYFVPVKPNKGMWLDFNLNHRHTHNVAVVISIQGVNPITGQKTDVLRLEQYRDKCPVHDIDFKQDRFCEKCNYKWEAQNYLCESSQEGAFWIDGFRNENGVVRQYIFTEEEIRSVAGQIIGKDKVYAIGIAFFLSKEPKPKPVSNTLSYDASKSIGFAGCDVMKGDYMKGGILYDFSSEDGYSTCCSFDGPPKPLKASYSVDPKSQRRSRKMSAVGGAHSAEAHDVLRAATSLEEIQEIETKLEIGAGAKINQRIIRDVNDLNYWADEPAGFIQSAAENTDPLGSVDE